MERFVQTGRKCVQKNEQNVDTENPCVFLSVAVHIVDISLPFVTNIGKKACLTCSGVNWYLEERYHKAGSIKKSLHTINLGMTVCILKVFIADQQHVFSDFV